MKDEKPMKLYQLFLKHGMDPEFKRKFTQTILAMLAFFAVIWLLLYLTDTHKYYGPSTGEACDVFVARMRDAYHRRMGLTRAEEDGLECCRDRPDHAGCSVFDDRNGKRIGMEPRQD